MKKYSSPTLKFKCTNASNIIATSTPLLDYSQEANPDNTVLSRERSSDWQNWEKEY